MNQYWKFYNFDNFLALFGPIFASILHWYTPIWSLFSLQLTQLQHCYGNMLPRVGSQMSELEDTVEEAGANSIEETSDGGDKNLIHLNSMSLN